MQIKKRVWNKNFPLGFGTIPIQKLSLEDSKTILLHALDKGIQFFDTARLYSDAEEKLGVAFKKLRSKVFFSSKTLGRTSKDILQDLEITLTNLQTDYVDLYQFHDVSKGEDLRQLKEENGYKAMLKARDSGKIKYLGVSGHNPDVLLKFLDTFKVDSVMIPVNIFDLDFDKVLEYANTKGIFIIGMKPFAGGLVDNYALSLKYALSKTDLILVGMKSIQEIDENYYVTQKSMGENFTVKDYEQLVEGIGDYGKILCRQCGYCMPCPGNLNLPRIFRLYREYFRFHDRENASKELKMMQGECLDCGQCEERCPYNIAVREVLVSIYVNIINKP